MKQRAPTIQRLIGERKIILALTIVVCITLLLTSISVWAYNVSDVARIDISAPNYEKARQSVIKDKETVKFSATGTLDANAMKDFQHLFDTQRNELNALSRFDGNPLGDDQLKTPVSQ